MDILNESDIGGIYIRHAVDESPKASEFNFHVHDRCEIFYFISGNAQYLVEGSVYPLERGSLLIMRPGEAHCTRLLSSERYERYAVNFPLSMFDGFDPRRRLMRAYMDRPLGKGNMFTLEGLEDIFSEMCGCISDEYDRSLLMMTKLLGLIDLIDHEYDRRSDDGDESQTFSERIVRYVNLHLFDRLSVPMLAERFFLSPSQFSRVFKQATGAPPWEYITAKRLFAAREMLMNGTSANKAADACGFGDYSVFYRAYVKRFGISPNKNF